VCGVGCGGSGFGVDLVCGIEPLALGVHVVAQSTQNCLSVGLLGFVLPLAVGILLGCGGGDGGDIAEGGIEVF